MHFGQLDQAGYCVGPDLRRSSMPWVYIDGAVFFTLGDFGSMKFIEIH
jgi:hypothetical protein